MKRAPLRSKSMLVFLSQEDEAGSTMFSRLLQEKTEAGEVFWIPTSIAKVKDVEVKARNLLVNIDEILHTKETSQDLSLSHKERKSFKKFCFFNF